MAGSTTRVDNFSMDEKFWETKTLEEMSRKEWESLCDGCGLCCLKKVEDEDTGEVYFTDIACRLLDTETCRCTNYPRRLAYVPECLTLSVDEPDMFHWLPMTCAYRCLAEDRDIPDWHPLITGDPESVHKAGISVRGQVTSETVTDEWQVLKKLG